MAKHFDGARVEDGLFGGRELQQQVAQGGRGHDERLHRGRVGRAQHLHERPPHRVVLEGGAEELHGARERVEAADGRHLQLGGGVVVQGGDERGHQVVGLDDALADLLVVGAQGGEDAEGGAAHLLGGGAGNRRRRQVEVAVAAAAAATAEGGRERGWEDGAGGGDGVGRGLRRAVVVAAAAAGHGVVVVLPVGPVEEGGHAGDEVVGDGGHALKIVAHLDQVRQGLGRQDAVLHALLLLGHPDHTGKGLVEDDVVALLDDAAAVQVRDAARGRQLRLYGAAAVHQDHHPPQHAVVGVGAAAAAARGNGRRHAVVADDEEGEALQSREVDGAAAGTQESVERLDKSMAGEDLLMVTGLSRKIYEIKILHFPFSK